MTKVIAPFGFDITLLSMTRYFWPLFPALVAVATPSVAAQAPAVRLEPTTKWTVDYADDVCTLVRRFGEGDEAVFLVLEQMTPSYDFRVSLFGKRIKLPAIDGDAKIQFGSEGPVQEQSYFSAKRANGDAALVIRSEVGLIPIDKGSRSQKEWSARDAASMEPTYPVEAEKAAATVAEVTFREPLRPALTLQTGPLAKPIGALQSCAENLVKSWGYDPSALRTMRQKPCPLKSPGDWVSPYDYPDSELRHGGRAIVVFRLDIDAAGKPTNCKILRSKSTEAFNTAVCRALVKRARFSPAIDGAGQPLPWFWQSSVVFDLPAQ